VLAFAWSGLVLLSGDMSRAGQMAVTVTGFDTLEGWTDDNHSDGLIAFLRSCPRLSAATGDLQAGPRRVSAPRLAEICALAQDPGLLVDAAAARRFFEAHFEPALVTDGGRETGLFTGYFEPRYEGSRRRGGNYATALLRRPEDLERSNGQYGRRVGGALQPYYTRREIESGILDGRGLELVWLKSAVDAFFVHVQGSARILLDDGTTMNVAFAAKNGQDYTAIGKVLVDRGALAREDVSMQTIRAWLESHRDEARAVMWENASFIFFQETEAAPEGVGPPGAAGVGLTAGRSLAVDKDLYAYGLPMWLETTLPGDAGETAFRRLMVAQDTGSAIRGAVRGDVFVGSGDAAGAVAGRMKQDGRLFVLLPRDTAAVPPQAAPASGNAGSNTLK
jgi:membrane-bound lytic murein transglycosylase A